MSSNQIKNVQRLIQATQARIQQRQAKGKPTRNLEKTLAEYRTRLAFYKADTPEKVKALKKLEGVAYTEAGGRGEVIETTSKPKTETKAEKPRVGVTAEPIQDLHAELDKLKGDADKLQSQIGVTKKQQDELKQTLKKIEAARDKLKKKKQTLKEIRETAAKVEKIKEELKEKLEIEKRSRGSWYGERPTIDFHELTQTLYEKSNYPSKAEITKALEEKGLAAKEDFKPKSVGEALTRLAYATCEIIQGGITEATLGLGHDPRSSERPLALPLQVAGGLLTPTALDYAFGAVLAKLGVTKKGRKLINKIKDLIDKGDDIPKGLTVAEAKQFEKILGNSGITTSDLRKLDKKTLRTIQEVAEYYEKHPARFTAGASYVPPEQLFYDEIIDDLGWDDDIYIDFLKTYGDRLNIDPNVLAGVLLRVSLDDAVKVVDSTAVKIPDDYKDRPASTLTRPKSPSKTEPSTDISEEETTDQPPGEKPIPTPPGQTPIQDQPQEQVPKLGEPYTPPEEPTSEPTEPEPPPETPPLKLSPEKQKKRRELNLMLFNGPRRKYTVKFVYPRGQSQTVTVEARSYPEALNKAQRIRRSNRYIPSKVDMVRM